MSIRNPKRFATPILILFGLLGSLATCKKHSSGPSLASLGPDVYIAGSVNRMAVYWNNGAIHYLTDTSIQQWSYAGHVVFSGNDMYISGSQLIYTNNILAPVYWKNGGLYNLTAGPQGEATNIAVSGNDVYVCGIIYSNFMDNSAAVYWKNGVLDSLSHDTSGVAQIITSGADVYAAGAQTINGNSSATVWKNGVPTQLSNTPSFADALGFSGNDLYIAGIAYSGVKDTAVLWKNGVQTLIGPCLSLNGMSISNGDVYVAGSIAVDTFNAAGVCWKNGAILTQLPNNSEIYGICVSGTDVYLTGLQNKPGTNTPHAFIWKNGVAIDLGEGSFAYSVTVK